ncbi:methylamine utilization protein MauE [Roseimicrobium gellanilyticum]|uniref:Methylamine utilization protein MauE n=1 Tax=Roseimicrobium gellanilyticum TaxID=748857 RepID=A0A366HAV5_9BACT|nr:MauE/DoxX family redox-associated membrane protein [Roseimicrobium gellanilyticum]RBP39039.1 methylamine utilization protein MauE [Roseimicrobium gellanilyticum]
MSTSDTPWWRTLLRWFLGLLLVWAALGKLANLQEFYVMLVAYRLPLPQAMLRGVAMVLPWMELLCGLLLIAGLRQRAALAWSLVMFVTFVMCTGQAWLRGLKIACGCLDLRFVGIEHGSSMAAMLESVEFAFLRSVVLAAAAVLVLQYAGRKTQDAAEE